MAKFSNCLQIVNNMPQRDQDALLARLDELQAQGMTAKEAQLQAAIDVLAQVEREGEIRMSADRVTDTPAFKRWFGDSKVLDKKGRPLIVYHSTASDFDTFEKTSDIGFHFGSAAVANKRLNHTRGEVARREGQKKQDTVVGAVMPVYLSISNPLEVVDAGDWTLEQFGPQLVDLGLISQSQLEKIEADAEKVSERAGRDFGARFMMRRQYGIDQMRRAIENAGYDGLKYANKYEASKSLKSASPSAISWVALYPEQIKSAIGNNGEFDPYESSILKSVDRPQFYSQLQRAIEGVPDRLSNMGAMAWKQWIDSNGPKLGVKKEEIDWSGIKDYLDLQGKAKLSKDDLSAYLDDSGVKISEVTLGAPERTVDGLPLGYEIIDEGDGRWSFSSPSMASRLFSSRDDAVDAAKRDAEMELENGEMSVSQPKYGNYTLPGGENYREVLITLPSQNPVAGVSPVQAARTLYGKEYADLTTEQQTEVKRRISEGDSSPVYQSSHWRDPNVLAHIRVNDRTDADGKRVLFVEEVQSDWGQEGKKKGFATSDTTGWRVQGTDESDPSEVEVLDANGRSVWQGTARGTDRQIIEQASKSGVPAAPFVTKTEGWVNLAIKRIAMMAVEGGYDKVAFVNGEQSAAHYSLAKQVDYLGWTARDNGGRFVSLALKDGAAVQLFVDGSGTVIDARGGLDAAVDKQLDSVLGKEVADKIMSEEKGELEGEGLKTGDQGMIKFYGSAEDPFAPVGKDKSGKPLYAIIPQALNKLLPKLGGGKLDMVAINGQTPDKQVDHLGFDKSEVQFKRDAPGNWFVEKGEEFVKPGEGRYWTGREWSANDGDTRLFSSKEAAQASVTALQQPGFDVTDKMRETVGQGVPLFSRDRVTDTPEFKKWFGKSKVVNAKGEPLVMYHGTRPGNDITEFDESVADGIYFTPDPDYAKSFTEDLFDDSGERGAIYPAYLSLQNPYVVRTSMGTDEAEDFLYRGLDRRKLEADGHDGAMLYIDGDLDQAMVFKPGQIKSATGNNGQFDPANPDIRKSADRPWFDDLAKLKVTTNYQLGDLLKTSKKLSWWDRTVGTQYNLAQKHPQFKRVFDAVQRFIGDVSAYATRAADLAPNFLPKLESWKDIAKTPLSAADVKALRDPIFGGTLKYTRDEDGNIIETEDVSTAGVVFKDEELREMFGLDDRQIGLYREFRRATNKSLSDLAVSDMLRYLGTDGEGVRQRALDAGNLDSALNAMVTHLDQLIEQNPKRAEVLENTKKAIKEKAGQAIGLMARGYAPLSRFGQYTVDAVSNDGERLYFSMFENERDAQAMAREMKEQYPDAVVQTGTMSQESYKLFSGVTPETLALFGESLGLEESSDDAKSQIFQEYLKAAKTNRSAMKRLIQRKGIDGFSEDAGRVLAGFVYSNARQISTNLHAGEIGRSAAAVTDGDVKDAAIRLMEYVQNPREEAQALRGLMFTQFIGGSIASAMVNLTQPFTMTLPYLSQFAGATGAGKLMTDAVKLASRGIRNDDDLSAALKRGEDEGTVSPQEVHQLMAQAQGKGSLQSGDGTLAGDTAAKVNNSLAKLGLGWGRLFSAAEQFNRRVTFIAAYKMARDKGMADPYAFAVKAISETQGVYNKGNKPAWARGAVGGTLFTFKQYSIGYVEFLRRMWGNGPEGKKAVGLALGVLFLMSGMGGMPGADDLDDVIDGFMQRVLGRSFDSKQAKKEFFASILGQAGAEFVMSGISGIPGMPIDVANRMGLGNLIPGTGLLTKKRDYARDYLEIAGPAGTLFTNAGLSVAALASGDVRKAAEVLSPVAVQNALKSKDMAEMGFYRDMKGRKVVDTDAYDAAIKAIGFQPRAVAQVQDATGTQANLIAQNKLRETEIADKWAAGRIEKDPAKVEEAKQMLADWNRNNPESKISIDANQINKRVQEANKTKAQRVAATAPKEVRDAVKKELERVN